MKKRITIVTITWAFMMLFAVIPASVSAESEQSIPVKPTELIYEKQTAPKIPVEITDQDPVIWDNYRGKIYELILPQAGTLQVSVFNPDAGKQKKDMKTVFSKVKNFSEPNVDYCHYSFDPNQKEEYVLTSGNAGDKYYLAIANVASKFESQSYIRAAFYAAKGRTIEFGRSYVFGCEIDKDGWIADSDFKFTATKSGYIDVDIYNSNDGDSKVSLLNENKKCVSGIYRQGFDGYTYFGVQKGKTYYLRVNSGGRPEYGPYKLRLRDHAVKEKSGVSRKKAVLVKKNKLVKGYVLPGKKTSDWYKIKVTKKRKIKVWIKNRFSDQCYFDVYNKKGKKLKTKQKIGYADWGILSKTKYVRLAKGTYYIKVYNKTKGDSGGYELKWK